MRVRQKRQRTVVSSIISSGTVGMTTILLNLFSLPLIFSSIGADTYGIWLLLTAVATFIYQADMGVGSAVMHRVAAASSDEERSRVASSSLAWMASVSIIAIPIYFACAQVLGNTTGFGSISENEVDTLKILGCILVGSIWMRLFTTLLPALGLWTLERGFQMVALLLRLVGTLYVTVLNPSILVLAAVETACLLLPGVLALVYVARNRLVRISLFKSSWVETKRLLSYSTKSFTVSLASNVIVQAGPLIVGVIGTSSDVSYYTAATRVYGGAKQVLSWIIDPFVPALSRIKSDESAVQEHFLSLSKVAILFGAMLSISLLISADPFVSWWLGAGEGSQSVTPILQVMLIGLILNASHLPSTPVANAIGRPGAFILLYLIWAFCGSGLGVWMGSHYGAVGVAAGMAAPLLVLQPLFLLRMRTVLRLPIRRWFFEAGGPALAFCLVGLIVAWLPLSLVPDSPIREASGTLTFLMVYAGLLVVLRNKIQLRAVRDLVSIRA